MDSLHSYVLVLEGTRVVVSHLRDQGLSEWLLHHFRELRLGPEDAAETPNAQELKNRVG